MRATDLGEKKKEAVAQWWIPVETEKKSSKNNVIPQ